MDKYILVIKTTQTQIIKTLVESLKEVLRDVNIVFTKNDISLSATNQINTLLIKLKLKTSQFEYYFCKNEEIRIGVNIPSLFKLLKRASNNDSLSIYIDENDKINLGIKLESSNITTNYKLKLLDIDPDPEHYNISKKIKYDNIISVNSQEFHSLIKNMNDIAEYVEIKFANSNSNPYLSLRCDGDFASQTSIFKINNDNYSNNINIKKNELNDNVISGLYDLKNISLFIKCSQISYQIDLKMGNDIPLAIKYRIGNLGNLNLLLSPINKDEDKIY